MPDTSNLISQIERNDDVNQFQKDFLKGKWAQFAETVFSDVSPSQIFCATSRFRKEFISEATMYKVKVRDAFHRHGEDFAEFFSDYILEVSSKYSIGIVEIIQRSSRNIQEIH
jgi:hypothetical protein